MAGKITQTLRLETVNGNLRHKFDPPNKQYTQTTAKVADAVHTVATSDNVFDVTAVGAANQGLLVLYNLDATNYVKFGKEIAGALSESVRLMPGDYAIIPLIPSTVYRWQANAAAVEVRAILYAR